MRCKTVSFNMPYQNLPILESQLCEPCVYYMCIKTTGNTVKRISLSLWESERRDDRYKRPSGYREAMGWLSNGSGPYIKGVAMKR
jgi:hypothetical protein